MKRIYKEDQSFTIENKAKRFARTKNIREAKASSSSWPPWFAPGTYCGKTPAVNVNSNANECSQPNYPALWSYRYGIAPVRNWFISNIVYANNADDSNNQTFVHPADQNSADPNNPDAFNSNQCLDSTFGTLPKSLGSDIVATQSLLRAQNEPYWVAIISFFIALFFYGEKSSKYHLITRSFI
jgi:hypothetical protein